MEIEQIIPLVQEAPSFAMFILLFLEVRGLRKELVPILNRLDERVEK